MSPGFPWARRAARGVLIVLGALLLGSLWRWRFPAPRAAPAPQPAAGTGRSPGGMRLEQAYAAAESLVRSRRSLESLPYFLRMAELVPTDDWALHHDYANALQGASLQSRPFRGVQMPAMRSSLERIALARLALAELDRATELAHAPAVEAAVHLSRARQLGTWGLRWDALSEVRAATEADPTWALATKAARAWALRPENLDLTGARPTRSLPQAPGRPRAPAPRGP